MSAPVIHVKTRGLVLTEAAGSLVFARNLGLGTHVKPILMNVVSRLVLMKRIVQSGFSETAFFFVKSSFRVEKSLCEGRNSDLLLKRKSLKRK